MTSGLAAGKIGTDASVRPRPDPRTGPVQDPLQAIDEGEDLIGAPIARAIEGVAACGAALGPVVGRKMRAVVDRTTTDLKGGTFKIAVIGQTKAGKSSLINALVKQPALLPADVNPWTSVVTRLHFGEAAPSGQGMLFHFFTSEEWRDLAQGGGPLAAMIDRLVPESRREELIEQLALVRRRAEQRLGSDFGSLLGRQHRFSRVSEEVLARYVCGCDGMDPPDDKAPGHFADITKLADLHFDRGMFACPTIVIDTPGVNDPFMVRDDMTHRHLGDADICVLVLNAQQALSTADMDLLRLLHGLHRDRIVVFVNRMDVLRNVISDSDKVLRSIRRRLEQAFPSDDIPIIGGSARWGEYAENLVAADIQPLVTPALGELARHLEIIDETEPEAWVQSRQPDLERIQNVLRRISGMPALREAISDLLVTGPGRHVIERARVALSAVIHSVETASANDLRALASMSEAVTGDKRTVLRQLARIEQDFRGIKVLAQELNAATRAFEHDITLMKEIGLQHLGIQLEGVVEAFADAEGTALELATANKPALRMWRCDINPLRQTLARQFLTQYRHLVDQLLEMQESSVSGVLGLLSEAAPGYALEMGYRPPHLIDPSPSIAALGQVIALDLGRPWLDWWKRWQQSDSRAVTLRRLIRSEFQPVIEQLVAAARHELDTHTEEATDRFDAELKSTMQALRSRQKHFAAVYVEMLEKRQARTPEELLHEYSTRTQTQKRRMARLDQAKRQLEAAMAMLS